MIVCAVNVTSGHQFVGGVTCNELEKVLERRELEFDVQFCKVWGVNVQQRATASTVQCSGPTDDIQSKLVHVRPQYHLRGNVHCCRARTVQLKVWPSAMEQ